MGFTVYSDFENYVSGIYHHVSGSLAGASRAGRSTGRSQIPGTPIGERKATSALNRATVEWTRWSPFHQLRQHGQRRVTRTQLWSDDNALLLLPLRAFQW